MKNWWRIVISIFLLIYLVIKLNIQEIANALSGINIFIVLLSLPLFLSLQLVRTYKWKIGLKALNIKTDMWTALKAMLIGTFYGMITPGRAGELSRIYYVNGEKSILIPTVIWDKLIEVFALIFLSVISILLFFRNIELIYMISATLIVLIIFIFLILNEKVIGLIAKLLGHKNVNIYLEKSWKLVKDKKTILKMFLLSLVYYIGTILGSLFIIGALDKNLPLFLGFSLPLIILIGNTPITIGGLGLREGVAALVFKMMNSQPSLGFMFSLLMFFVMTLVPGIIGYILAIKPHTKQSAKS